MVNGLCAVLVVTVSSAYASQPTAPAPIEAPLRDLRWGQLNFLHTTDTHGWHAGHLQEPSYSADWGDYISFATKMREKAEANGQDLLLVDTGDRIEGNGLYDASDPKGKYTFDIFKEQHIDVVCTGNHELYKQNSSENEYLVTVPNFKDNYLASNLDIIDPRTGDVVPLAPRYKKFTTKKQGIRIIAMGFIYDFLRNYNNTVVQPVEETVKERWFHEVIRDREVDLFLIVGHVPARSVEFDAIFKAIRGVHWDTPIQFFGGHWHIRDYKKYDAKSYALASGRFMETIGFQSIDGLSTAATKGLTKQDSPSFFRKYIDSNLFSFHHHTGLDDVSFPTEHGQKVSRQIKAAREALKLDSTFGCARQDLWMNRAKYPSNNSIYTWLEQQVLPDIVHDPGRESQPRLVIVNTGGIRFDIFKGPFTRDSTYIVSPFTSGFRYIRDVPYDKANKVLSIVNNNGQILQAMDATVQDWMLAPPENHLVADNNFGDRAKNIYSGTNQFSMSAKPDLTLGYTTKDDAGTDGDDTIHSPITFYQVPNCIQSEIHPPGSYDVPDVVDVVYIEFVQPWILLAFKFLGLDYSAETAAYMEGENLTTLIAKWVSDNWKDNC